jgi:hypothetical protein
LGDCEGEEIAGKVDAKIGERQKVFGKELHDVKLLSDAGWAAVEIISSK